MSSGIGLDNERRDLCVIPQRTIVVHVIPELNQLVDDSFALGMQSDSIALPHRLLDIRNGLCDEHRPSICNGQSKFLNPGNRNEPLTVFHAKDDMSPVEYGAESQ